MCVCITANLRPPKFNDIPMGLTNDAGRNLIVPASPGHTSVQ